MTVPSAIYAISGVSTAEAEDRFGQISQSVWWRSGPRRRATCGDWEIQTVGAVDVEQNTTASVIIDRRNDTPEAAALLFEVDEFGVGALENLRGNHAALLIDHRSASVHLSTDFMATKSLYWGTTGDKIAVASEPGAVQLLLGVQPAADNEMVEAYVARQKREVHRTFHHGVFSVPPDVVMTLGSPVVERRRLFTPAAPVSDDEACQRVRSSFDDTIQRYTAHTDRFACNLSGGLDSGVVAATAGADRSVFITHLVSGIEDDETKRAKELALHHNATHDIVHIQPNDVIERIVEDIDCYGLVHPTAWLSGSTIERAAALNAQVILPGHLGDQWLTMAGGSFAQAARDGEVRALSHYLGSMAAPPQTGLFWALGSSAKNFARGRFVGSYAQHCREVFRVDASLRLTITSLERFGARFGVDVQLPFADRNVVEALLGCTSMQRNRSDRTKWILREAFRDLLPESYVDDPMKANFYTVPSLALGDEHVDGNAYGQIRQQFAQHWMSTFATNGTKP